jgi:hypothetical protein
MDFKTVCVTFDWIHVANDRIVFRVLVYMIMSTGIPKKTDILLSN